MAIPASRDEQLTRFYQSHAERLRWAITQQTCGLNDAIIDDACAFAQETLRGRPDIDLEHYQAYWWLYRVALRQAWALGRARRREHPAGGLDGADENTLEPASVDADVCDLVADRVDRATVHEVLGRLHWRERRELLLYATASAQAERTQCCRSAS